MARARDNIFIGDYVVFYEKTRIFGEKFRSGVVVEELKNNKVLVSTNDKLVTVDLEHVAHTPGALSQRIYKKKQNKRSTTTKTTSVPIAITKTKTVKLHNPPVRPQIRPKVGWWGRVVDKIKGNF